MKVFKKCLKLLPTFLPVNPATAVCPSRCSHSLLVKNWRPRISSLAMSPLRSLTSTMIRRQVAFLVVYIGFLTLGGLIFSAIEGPLEVTMVQELKEAKKEFRRKYPKMNSEQIILRWAHFNCRAEHLWSFKFLHIEKWCFLQPLLSKVDWG